MERMKKTELCAAMMVACGGVLLSAGQAAIAQTSQSLERVELTGSNIRRTQSETASPIQTVTREDIEKSGKSTVAEFLQTLAVDNQGSVPMTYGRGFAGSSGSGISLRGSARSRPSSSSTVVVSRRTASPTTARRHSSTST